MIPVIFCGFLHYNSFDDFTFVCARNLGVLFSTFAGFALLFCIKVVAEGEAVIEHEAVIESEAVQP